VRHRGVAVLLDLERLRPAVFDRVAEAMERSDAGIAAPREHQLRRGAAADHLVVDQIRRHPDQREIRQPLPDDFMAGRKRDEVREALERDARAPRSHIARRRRRAG
jgi:hypothetical protein